MKRIAGYLTLAALLLFLTTACGYRFTGEGPGPRPGLRTIAIPVFENKTAEPDLGAILAGDLRREFMKRGDLRVVPVDEAEAVFYGVVKSIDSSPVAHRELPPEFANRLTLEARLYLTADIRCVDAQTGQVLWQDPNFTYWKVYRQVPDPNNPDPMVNFDNRQHALKFISKEMAIRVHDRFMSNF